MSRQSFSGHKNALLEIIKRGDGYLRKNLVHGVRSVVCRAKHLTDQLSQLLYTISETLGVKKACMTVANKHIRIAWQGLV